MFKEILFNDSEKSSRVKRIVELYNSPLLTPDCIGFHGTIDFLTVIKPLGLYEQEYFDFLK